MKKTIVFVIILWILFAFVFMTACYNRDGNSDWENIIPNNLWTVTDGITLRLSQDSYLPGTAKMTLILENHSETIMRYGKGWSFEKYINGKWQEVKYKDNYGFTLEGYELSEYNKTIFAITTDSLAEPLSVGLYRVTGCELRVSADSEIFSYDGDFIEHPPYQLEFTVSETADEEIEYKEETTELAVWQLNEIENWQWYTLPDCWSMYENAGMTSWSTIRGKNGLIAVLYREKTPENEILNIGDKLMLDIFDRKTGKRYEISTEPKFEYNEISAYQDGFKVENDNVFYCFIDGETATTVLLSGE